MIVYAIWSQLCDNLRIPGHDEKFLNENITITNT